MANPLYSFFLNFYDRTFGTLEPAGPQLKNAISNSAERVANAAFRCLSANVNFVCYQGANSLKSFLQKTEE